MRTYAPLTPNYTTALRNVSMFTGSEHTNLALPLTQTQIQAAWIFFFFFKVQVHCFFSCGWGFFCPAPHNVYQLHNQQAHQYSLQAWQLYSLFDTAACTDKSNQPNRMHRLNTAESKQSKRNDNELRKRKSSKDKGAEVIVFICIYTTIMKFNNYGVQAF